MRSELTDKRHLDSARKYFVEVDGGRIPDELFAADVEFFFPKFGVGRGVDGLRELAAGLGGAGLRVRHHRDQLQYLVCGTHVVVEGTTEGDDGAGGSWNGGETPGGRFCSTFDFNDKGLIQRMYIYLDPDYTSADRDRFHWKRATPLVDSPIVCANREPAGRRSADRSVGDIGRSASSFGMAPGASLNDAAQPALSRRLGRGWLTLQKGWVLGGCGYEASVVG